MFCCCGSWSCGSCGCGDSCGCDCGCGSDNGVTTLPIFPDTPAYTGLSQFPVYVSYPAFYAGETSINGANQAIFTVNGTTAATARRFYRV